MDALEPGTIGIGEEQIAESASLVRALVVQRLEKMWRACEPYINTELGKPDPRYIEAGIRVTDRLTRLYRLDSPVAAAVEAEDGSREQVRELVGAEIRALALRMGESTPA